MAADALEMIMSVMCQQNTLAQCESFVQAYPDITQQVLWFLFFPTIFIILFIYKLSDKVAENINQKFKVLIGVAIFVFIVVQGWYHFFLILSKFWFVSIIILGGFWAFMNMGVGRQNSSSTAVGDKTLKSVSDYVKKRAVGAIRGDADAIYKRIEREMDKVEDMEKRIREYEETGNEYAASNLISLKMMKMQEIESMRAQLSEMTSFEGTKIGTDPRVKKIKNWLEEHSKGSEGYKKFKKGK